MISKLFDFLNGKKTVLGAIVAFCLGGAFTLGWIDQNTFDTGMRYDLLLLGVGLGHKVFKSLN